ncbi:MAG: 2-5 ligase family protein [Marmoricola sp.]|nr:2-5 ligase family protein [Marmoricola sp.]
MPTIGVSVAVPDPCGAWLQDYRVDLGDESARHIPTHITLLPPYDIEGDQLARFADHLAGAAATLEAFDVHLRGTGTFRPISPVVFVGVVDGIARCEQLARAVRSGPVNLTQSFPYHPHVTVAHHLDEALMDRAFTELADFECFFAVERIWLYVHDEVLGWQPTQSFELTLSARRTEPHICVSGSA